MVLGRYAVSKFLKRPRDDFSIYKRLSAGRLAQIAAKHNVEPRLWARLRRPQQIMLAIALRLKRFCIFADTGVGKTVTMLSLIEHGQDHGTLSRALVMVPTRSVKDEWEDEIKKHAPQLGYVLLPAAVDGKWWTIEEGLDGVAVVIETYAGIMRMVGTMKAHERRRDDGGLDRFNKMHPDRTLVRRLCRQFDAVIFDESHVLKNKHKLPFRIARKLAQHCQWVFTLSATPHGRDPSDLWAQLWLIDFGHGLGETLGLFYATFFRERPGYWGGVERSFIRAREKLLHRLLQHRSIRFPAEQADLPELVPVIKRVTLPADAALYYQRAKETMLAAGNRREMRNAFVRMRQISSGFVGFIDDDDGSRAEFVFPYNPKLELLLGLIDGLDPRHKVVVYFDFQFSADLIAKELSRRRLDFVQLDGRTSNTRAPLTRFKNDPGCRLMLLQNQFGIGLNLQAARYLLFFESPVSPIIRKQCVRRVERQHSAHASVFQYDLVMRDTYDERILAMLKEGKDLFEALIDGKVPRDTWSMARVA